ncbi:hypothetical protein NQ317_010307 [Molorchus minor]|uniref:RNase H type-1 domain-containing protein n=1 Tax=Molorchus minor TaxID=1323400 RepID=A0ABQ9J3M3_9CUCU|nr:hypothetical protein NQ317_010307 [Molorchus minor]
MPYAVDVLIEKMGDLVQPFQIFKLSRLYKKTNSRGVRYFGVRVGKPEKGLQGRTIQICLDSRAALLAIESSKVKSRLVLECKKTLNDLASRNKVILTWVPGNSGVRGNEEADRLAREESAMHPIGPEPILGVPYSMGLLAMKEPLRCSKIHGTHLQLSGIAEDPECRWCLDDEETSSHVLTECSAIVRVRERLFGSSVLNPEDIKSIQPRKLCTFAKKWAYLG